MPRAGRKKSSTGIYHIMIRGINRQTIFLDDKDNECFMQILTECKKKSGFQLFAYCLMGNHVHLLIKEEDEKIDLIFKRIGTSYVYRYNHKYERCGPLFQDRFKSEPVEDDAYFLTVLRYIHQNPLKAGMCYELGHYEWSSYKNYLGRRGIIDVDLALDLIGKNQFIEFMNQKSDVNILEIENKKAKLNDEQLCEKIKVDHNINVSMIQKAPCDVRDSLLNNILKYEGISIPQLARVTGISTATIYRINQYK